jgi:hypothetical protein
VVIPLRILVLKTRATTESPKKGIKSAKSMIPMDPNFSVFVPIWGIYIHLETVGAVFAGLRENSFTRLSSGYCKGQDA